MKGPLPLPLDGCPHLAAFLDRNGLAPTEETGLARLLDALVDELDALREQL